MLEQEIYKIIHVSKEDMEHYISKMKNNLEILRQHQIPETYPEEVESLHFALASILEPSISREKFIEASAFPLISKDWLTILAKYLSGKKCIEIMAGSGMISYGLKNEGIDIIATDDFSWEISNQWTDIEQIDCLKAIRKYAVERPYIIMSWPEMNAEAFHVLTTMREVNPMARLIYIGEYGGCCANSDFVNAANIIDSDYSRKINEKFQSWQGIHDLVMIIK